MASPPSVDDKEDIDNLLKSAGKHVLSITTHCLHHGLRHLAEDINFMPTAYDETNEEWRSIIGAFYFHFVMIICNPLSLKEFPEGDTAFKELQSIFTKMNKLLKTNPEMKVSPGPNKGYLSYCFDFKQRQFQFPQFDEILAKEWIIPRDFIIQLITDQWVANEALRSESSSSHPT
jgi:hypothetical protein